MKKIGIYVHIPFCKQKCYYCDFISFPNKEECISDYIHALKKEIENEAKIYKNEEAEIETIYIGGGTPSFINEKYISDVLTTIKCNFNVAENAEITIEVNPGTVNEAKIKMYKEIGINRISIGLQSTKNELLKKIGRIHTYEEFLECYELIKKVGFDNINVDLMLALPGQTLTDLKQSIDEVIKLNPNHISVYSLIVEENTPIEKMLNNQEIELPNEDEERKMYWETKKILEENGYIHYEISNFAKEGCESKHNLSCWKQEEYLGFGIAAHSYINSKRYCNINDMEKYIKNIEENNIENNKDICEIQTKEDMEKEYMLLSLRTINGVNIQDFKNKFVDNPIYIFRKELEKLVKDDLIEIDLNNIKLTNKGLDLANIVWQEFV